MLKKMKNVKWFIVGVFVVGMIGTACGTADKEKETIQRDLSSETQQITEMVTEDLTEIQETTEAEITEAETTEAEVTEAVTENKEDNVPTEYRSALRKAESYSSYMHMSKAALYDQLTSEYGEKFSEEAAQYALDHLEADWNANALAKAQSYQETMNMSPAAIRDQLVSEYGEKFTQEEADYAIANLK